jgi:hypothetical protein
MHHFIIFQIIKHAYCTLQTSYAMFYNTKCHINTVEHNLEDYPNGIRLCFVKSKRDAINTNEKGKIERP